MTSPPTRDRFSPYRGNDQTPGKVPDSPLPPIAERLAYLRPSRELLEFYRQKIAQYDEEQEELLQMLEKYKDVTGDQHRLQWEVQQREGEITELQNALSDMQVYLFQEREQALRLYAENDRLKIRELEDRKKIQHLLALVGPDIGEITYFHRDPPHKVTIPQKTLQPRTPDNLKKAKSKFGPNREGSRRLRTEEGEGALQHKKDNQILLLQVEALQAQMEEQTRLAKEQLEALVEDRRIHVEEGRVQRERDQNHIQTLSDKLKHTQNLLHESTKDFLQLKFEARANEKAWMVEKDRLLRELDTSQDHSRRQKMDKELLGSGPKPQSTCLHLNQPDTQQGHKEALKAMQEDLKQAYRLAEMYRKQCVTLETDLSQIREEGDVGREIFKDRSDKMAKRLQMMTRRYEALEKRRMMEVEGFKADIKQLRQKFKDVEKHLFKVILNVGPNQDLAILHEVHQTNSRTKKVQGELRTLKAKIYGLENELRHS